MISADIYDIFENHLTKIDKQLKGKCLGGGRIRHEPENKEIHVYGYSQVRRIFYSNFFF